MRTFQIFQNIPGHLGSKCLEVEADRYEVGDTYIDLLTDEGVIASFRRDTVPRVTEVGKAKEV